MKPEPPIDIITISREYGAGGSDLARRLGARLGWPVLDRELVHLVAERLRLRDEDVEVRDEHAPGFLEQVAATILMSTPELVIAPEVATMPNADHIAAVAQRVIRDAATTPPLIIVGHGAQCLLHRRPGTLHLRLVGPLEDRLDRVCARRGCNRREAAALARRMDEDRRHYLRRYFQRDWHDATLYDLQINTGRVTVVEAAELIAALVRGRGEG